MKWIYKNEIIDEIPKGAFGFIYEIELKDGRKYIGSKQFLVDGKRKVGKREVEKRGKSAFRKYKYKGKDKNKKGTWIYYEEGLMESNWKTYLGSNKEMKTEIKPSDVKKKTILRLCFKGKSELKYMEAQELFNHKVLEKKEYLNGNIQFKRIGKIIL